MSINDMTLGQPPVGKSCDDEDFYDFYFDFDKIEEGITDRRVKRYLYDIGMNPMLTIEEEEQLVAIILKNDAGKELASKKLVQANLRCVVAIAKQYQGKGVELVDLISDSNIGLIYAAENCTDLDHEPFICFADKWIRKSILKELENN